MSKSPEDIIELTDIIEHGPGAPKQDGAAEGVDLSFERELEDLFADSPGDKPAGVGPDLPGLDSLHLPDEAPKADGGDDIDLDGLDALLAEAEKSQPADTELPELTDDFLSEPEPALAPEPEPEAALEPELELEPDAAPVPEVKAPAAAAVAAILATPAEAAGPGLAALGDRLDTLEEKLAGLGDTLAASFTSMLDAAIDGLKAELPVAAEPLDEEALAERVKEQVLAGLPEPASEAAPEAPALDAEALEARMSALVDERLEAFKAELPAPQEPLDEEALAERVKEGVLAGLPETAPVAASEAPALDTEALEARMAALVDERLEAFKAELPAPQEPLDVEALEARLAAGLAAKVEAIPVPADPAPLLNELAARLESRLAALEAEATMPTAPTADLGAPVSKDDLAALRLELLAEIKKAVPAAAARIIREEIQALVQEMD